MSKIYTFLLVLFGTYVLAQGTVGVNTDAPTKTLDVNGEVRIRQLTDYTELNPNVLVADAEGNIFTSKIFRIAQVNSKIAQSRVEYTPPILPYDVVNNNIDLGLSTNVVIPAGKKAIVIIDYSVPIGFEPSKLVAGNRYYGIKFLKNGEEKEVGSRKHTATDLYFYKKLSLFQGKEGYNSNMTSISNQYIEKIDNTAGNTDMEITYTLKGYAEKKGTNERPVFLFNMYAQDATAENYNWGRGTILQTVYLK